MVRADDRDALRQRGGAVGVVRDSNGGVPKWDELLKCKCDIDATLEELMERGYEDAYRQFIEPVMAPSGERVGHP